MTTYISYRTDNRNVIAAAVIDGRRHIKRPGRTLLHCLVRAAARNHWRSGIRHRDLLTARATVATGIRRSPRPSRIRCAATMSAYIRHCADDRNYAAPAIVRCCRGIKRPRCPLLNRLIRAAARDHRRGRIHDVDGLRAL